MEKGHFMKLLLRYIWYRRKVIFMFIVYQLIFCIIIVLNQLKNLDKLLYGVYISVFISVCYGIWDFAKYSDRIRKTEEMRVNLENVLELMPQASDDIEKNCSVLCLCSSLWFKLYINFKGLLQHCKADELINK